MVDDNVDAAETLAELLELWGHTACVRHDGPAAIAATPAFAPDLVLLDIDLPGMDGHEVARRLRDEPGVKETVLVALTGFGQEDDRRRSREAGFDHHLTKPVDPEALRELLSRPLAREEAQHGGTDEADPA